MQARGEGGAERRGSLRQHSDAPLLATDSVWAPVGAPKSERRADFEFVT